MMMASPFDAAAGAARASDATAAVPSAPAPPAMSCRLVRRLFLPAVSVRPFSAMAIPPHALVGRPLAERYPSLASGGRGWSAVLVTRSAAVAHAVEYFDSGAFLASRRVPGRNAVKRTV